jgi:hypothetical protein
MLLKINNRGSITIFLLIIISFCLVIAQIIVDIIRIRYADIQIKEAMDIASISTLSNFSQILKERYGLNSINFNKELLQEEYLFFLEKNLSSRSNQSITNFHDLYDYNIEELSITPIYNLSSGIVLKNQIEKFMQLRGPKSLSKGVHDELEFFLFFLKHVYYLNDKIYIDKKMQDILSLQDDLIISVTEINNFGIYPNIRDYYSNIVNKIYSKMVFQLKNGELNNLIFKLVDDVELNINTKININNQIQTNANQINLLEREIQNIENKILEHIDDTIKISDEAIVIFNNIKIQILELKDNLKELRNSVKDVNTSFTETLIIEIDTLENHIDYILSLDIKENLTLNKETLLKLRDINNDAFSKNIRIQDYGMSLPSMEDLNEKINLELINLELSKYVGYINSDEGARKPLTFNLQFDRSQGIRPEKPNYFNAVSKLFQEVYKKQSFEDSKIELSILTSKVNHNDIKNEMSNNKILLDDIEEFFIAHPSKKYFIKNKKLQDYQFDIEGLILTWDYSMLHKIIQENLGVLNIDLGEITRVAHDLFVNEYIIGNFSSNLSRTIDDSMFYREGLNEFPNFKEDSKNLFKKAEIEYILWGNNSELLNSKKTFYYILSKRFILNFISLYSDNARVQQLESIIEEIYGQYNFNSKYMEFKELSSALAFTEAVLDTYLIMNGEKVPLLKNNDWIIDLKPNLQGFIETIEDSTLQIKNNQRFLKGKYSKEFNGIINNESMREQSLYLNYNNYLRLALLLMNEDDKLSRIGDVIELNLKAIDGNNHFRLDNCITSFRIESLISFKYLFSVTNSMRMQFLSTEDNVSRLNNRRIIYRGY